MSIEKYQHLIGVVHRFPDGITLTIVSIKQREDTPWVTYETNYGNSLPRRFSSKIGDFLDTYGHLFNM